MTTDTSSLAIPSLFGAAALPDRIVASATLEATSLYLATMAIIVTPIKKSGEVFAQKFELLAPLVPALRFASHCRQLLRRALLSLLLKACLLAPVLLHLSHFASVQMHQAAQIAQIILYHSIGFFKRATRAVWNTTHVKRLRKKLEFEFFTLILGGGNSLCLVIFWPGWCILALAGLVISTWCTS